MLDDFSKPEARDDPDTDFTIDNMNGSADKIYYGLNSKLRVYQYHYNAAKVKNKLVSLTWIIASFIGFGYLLSGQETGLPLNILTTISLLACLSTIGLMLLWFLDIVVYHRLIEAIFTEQLLLEESFPILSATHHNMVELLAKGKKNPVIFDASFYACFTSIFLTIANGSLFLKLQQQGSGISCWIFGILLLFTILFEFILIKVSMQSGFSLLYKK